MAVPEAEMSMARLRCAAAAFVISAVVCGLAVWMATKVGPSADPDFPCLCAPANWWVLLALAAVAGLNMVVVINELRYRRMTRFRNYSSV